MRVGHDAQRRAAEDAILLLERRTNGHQPSVPTVTREKALFAVLDRLGWTNFHLGWQIRRLCRDPELAKISREDVLRTELAVRGFVAGTGIRRTECAWMRQIDLTRCLASQACMSTPTRKALDAMDDLWRDFEIEPQR